MEKPHPSLRRNELISNAFFCRKLIEQWGSGTIRIQEDCLSRGLPKPIFSEYCGGFSIKFLFKKTIGPTNTLSKDIAFPTISKRQKEILEILQNHKMMSISELAKKYKRVSESTLKRDLDILRKEKFVSNEGMGRNTRWKVKGEK